MAKNTGARIGRQYPTMEANQRSYHAVIDMIVDQIVNRTRQDLQNWRQYQDAAANPDFPQWYGLQDFFDYLSPDGHFQSQKGIRTASVTGRRFMIRSSSSGKEDKAKTKLLQKKWFFDMMAMLHESEARAYTLLQAPDANAIINYDPLVPAFHEIPRRNFIPQLGIITLMAGGTEGVSILDPAFKGSFILMRSAAEFGYMNDIVPDLIWKKNARQGWAIFSERFGIPLVQIETNQTDKKEIDKLEAMAKKMGQAARAVMPIGSKMTVISSTDKGDPHKVYSEQIKLSNDEISKRILGGNMISDNGSSKSQSEVHERTLDEKIIANDLTNMEFVVNDQLLPLLRSYGMPLTDDDEFAFDRSANIAPLDHWTITQGMMQEGYEVNDQWLRERFNVDIIGRKEVAPVPPAPDPSKKPKARFFE